MKLRALLSLLAACGLAACGNDPTKRGACDDGSCSPEEDSGRDAFVPASDAGHRDAQSASDAARAGDAAPLVDAGLADAGPAACDASVPPTLPSLALTTVVAGRDRLVFAAQPRGSSDWYLVHQKGRIDVLSGGAVRGDAFLDLSALVNQGLDANDERGLLGLAFAPDYATSGKFYVALTPNRDGQSELNRDLVLEYERSGTDPYRADLATRKTILALEPSAGNHNGGNLLFGPDGMLYVGSGDGGGSCNSDKPGTPQDPSSLFGKILRLDPNGAEPYAAAGNPFSGASGDARVLHYGVRNPFRFGFDSLTGDFYFGDVGQDSYEEVSFAPAGAKGLNFGWAASEGNASGTCSNRALRPGSTETKPILSIDRPKAGAQDGPFRDYVSIIGGHVYRGSAIPALRGVYLFGDYTGRRMGALRQCEGRTSPPAVLRKARDPNTTEPYFTLPMGATFVELTAILEDEAHELYMVVNRSSLLKVVPGP